MGPMYRRELRLSLELTVPECGRTIGAVVLGGELAVPCIRNPLQRS